MTHRRYKVLPLLGQVELTLRKPVNGDKAAAQEQEHDAADKEQQLPVADNLAVAACLLHRLVDVDAHGDGVQRFGEVLLEHLHGEAGVDTERYEVSLVRKLQGEVVVFVRVVTHLEIHDAPQVFAKVYHEPLHKIFLAAQHVPVEHDVLAVQFRLERFDGDVHRAHVREYPVQARGVHLGRFHVERELFLLGGALHAHALLAVLALGKVHLVGELVKRVGTFACNLGGILRGGRSLVLDAHVAHDELEPVLERLADFLVLELHLPERARRQVGGAEHAVGVYLEMAHESGVLAAVVQLAGIAIARCYREVEREVRVGGLLACRNGLRDLDEPVLHEGALVLYSEVVLDAVVRHLQDLRCVHGPFRLRLVLHVQVRIVKQPRHRECNHGEDG